MLNPRFLLGIGYPPCWQVVAKDVWGREEKWQGLMRGLIVDRRGNGAIYALYKMVDEEKF